ncbi:MAG: hypothetical protein A2170_10815 [Deltaproteobacteria bacterium RBG_13_53_10]|nr:MAG: hypothetical protein A2170_10815 [Deltaproteobacteria bacterium RBG_13_53_10]
MWSPRDNARPAGGAPDQSEQDMDLTASSLQGMTQLNSSDDGSRNYVVFRIDRQHYALPLDHVIRAIRMVAFTPVPDAPPWVWGMINMAGQMLPVIDLRRLFGQTGKQPQPQDFLLVIRIEEQTAAIVVDEVLNVLELTAGQLQPPPAAVSQSRFLVGAFPQEDILILILSASRLLPDSGGKGIDGVNR